jgi:hypothetical protein
MVVVALAYLHVSGPLQTAKLSVILNLGVILGATALFFLTRIRLHAIRHDLLTASCAPWISIGFGAVSLPRWVGQTWSLEPGTVDKRIAPLTAAPESVEQVWWGLVGMVLVYLGQSYRAGRRAGAEEGELATAEAQTALGIDPMSPELTSPSAGARVSRGRRRRGFATVYPSWRQSSRGAKAAPYSAAIDSIWHLNVARELKPPISSVRHGVNRGWQMKKADERGASRQKGTAA